MYGFLRIKKNLKVKKIKKFLHNGKNKLSAIIKTPLFKIVAKIFIIAVIAASLLLNLFTHVIPVVKYYGNAMSPSLSSGQILLVSKTQNVSQGDIIAFYYNNKILVRRVVATSGQQVNIDIFGNVSVNGTELQETYVEEKSIGQNSIELPYDVPTHSVFVLGDNRVISMDSRLKEIGAISEDRIIGKVLFSLFPPKSVK